MDVRCHWLPAQQTGIHYPWVKPKRLLIPNNFFATKQNGNKMTVDAYGMLKHWLDIFKAICANCTDGS